MDMKCPVDPIIGSGGGKDPGDAPVEDPNTLSCNTIAKIIDVIGEGEIGGLVDGAKSIYFDDTPLMNEDGTKNFKGVWWGQRLGTLAQSPLPGFSTVEAETLVSTEIKHSLPVTRTITDTSIDSLRIKIMTPAMVSVDKDDGDTHGTKVELKVSIQPDGGDWSVAKNITISGKCTSNFERAFVISSISDYGAGPWLVKIERVTADSTTSRVQNQTYWSSYTTIIDEQLSFPYTAYVGLQVNAKQFGSHVPARGYEIYGRDTVYYPSNYDPVTREYTGIWDGNLQYGWTDNPAWCLFDLLSHGRYGLGLSWSSIDKWAFYTAGQYCDGLVPSGYKDEHGDDILEPRFTMNIAIATQEDAYHLINAMASAFMAMPFWSSGQLTIAQDSPTSASHLATPSNVVDGLFSYAGTGLKARHSVAMVTWNDPNDGYRVAVEVVEDQEAIARYGWRQIDILAVGCTRRSQAHRAGRWALYSELEQSEVLTFKGGFEFADCVPGNVIKVVDPAYSGVRFGGRVGSDCTTSTIVLDAPVTLVENETYTISVSLNDRTIEEREILNDHGVHTEIFVEPLGSAPDANCVWVISGSDVSPREFRVISNVEQEPNVFEITALIYSSSKYDRIENDLAFDDIPTSILPTEKLQPPDQFHITPFTYQEGNKNGLGVLVSWVNLTDPRAIWYDVEYMEVDGGWRKFGETSRNSVEVYGFKTGTYHFRIRSRGITTSSWFQISDVEIDEPGAYPPNIPSVALVGGGTSSAGNLAEIVWDSVRDTDYFPEFNFLDYRVRVLNSSGTVKRTSYVKNESFIYTRDMMIQDFGSPPETYKIEVVARDRAKRLSMALYNTEFSYTDSGGSASDSYHGVESHGTISISGSIVSISSGSNTYWYQGTKYTTTNAITCDLDSDDVKDSGSGSKLQTNKMYYCYFKDATGTLYWSTNVWSLKTKVSVCSVYWNGSAGALCKETHNHTRDLDWHTNAHLTIGTRYYSGLDLVKPTTTYDSSLELVEGVIYDEDLSTTITNALSKISRIWYLTGGVYTWVDSSLPYAGSSGDPKYANGTTLVSVADSKFVNMWAYASPDVDRPVYIVPDTAEYNTVALARAVTPPVLAGMGLTPELKLIYRFIYRGDGEFQESTDYRVASSLPSGFISSTSASSVSFVPHGTIASANVQAAIEELTTEKAPMHLYGTTDPPDPTGLIEGTIYLKYTA